MTSYPTPIAAEETYSAADLGIEFPNITIDIQESDGETLYAVINVLEFLAFHADYMPEYFTAEGVLKNEAIKALSTLLTMRYGAEDLYLDGEGEGAFMRFELALAVPATTTVDELGNLIWEKTKLVDFINESDPGTFGSPYLFGTLMTEQG